MPFRSGGPDLPPLQRAGFGAPHSNTWAAIRGAATAGQETIAKDVDEGRMTLFACQCGSRSRDHLHFRNRAFGAPPLVRASRRYDLMPTDHANALSSTRETRRSSHVLPCRQSTSGARNDSNDSPRRHPGVDCNSSVSR
jgi:hypothetical protein